MGESASPKQQHAWRPLLIGIAILAVGYMLWRAFPISVR